MARSNSDTTVSPTPFSPFSPAHSVGTSELSSDEPADLGAFTSVFRALNQLHHPRTLPPQDATPTASILATSISPSEYDSDSPHTVWSRVPIASYLSHPLIRESRLPTLSDEDDDEEEESDSVASDTEGVLEVDGDMLLGEEVEIELVGSGDMDDMDTPSLGDIDAALQFIAAERERFTAQRDSATSKLTVAEQDTWKHVIEPRRRRKKKKVKAGSIQILHQDGKTTELLLHDPDAADKSSSSPDYSSSPIKPHFIHSLPSTPPTSSPLSLAEKKRRKQHPSALFPSKLSHPTLHHSKSTPALPLMLPVSVSPSVHIPIADVDKSITTIATTTTHLSQRQKLAQLRTLAQKLRLMFPEDSVSLSGLLATPTSPDYPTDRNVTLDFVDPRGPPPTPTDTLVHIFVDESNISIGFREYLRRSRLFSTKKNKFAGQKDMHMCYAALALILERGRPITRRVMVTSSPLYQPMESARELGYEVRIYARVPEVDEQGEMSEKRIYGKARKSGNIHRDSLQRRDAGVASADSDPGAGGGVGVGGSPLPRKRPAGHNRANSASTSAGTSPQAVARVRYREQGVDELLQLKMHQAIAAVERPPTGATLVLATGDGAAGEFNEEGFLGCVRTALKRGWRVELYAWEGGLSQAYAKEFSEGAFGERFRIVRMERFAEDLLEV